MPSTDKGIFVGVDDSPAAQTAVEWAAREAVMRGLPLTLVHVLPKTENLVWVEIPMPENVWRQAERHGEETLRAAAKIAEEIVAGHRAVTVEQLTRRGNAVATLVEVSEDAAMVVVGCRGLGTLSRQLLGSVSSGLVHHAHCPVAVIHDEAKPGPSTGDPTRAPVVVGIDGSAASELATEIAFDEASRRGVDLVAVHAWSDPTVYAFPNEEWVTFRPRAEEELAERLAGFSERYPDVVVERVVVRDRPSHQLIEQSQRAQLVVVGSHGRGGFATMLLGSVSSAVAHSAHAAVIVARQS